MRRRKNPGVRLRSCGGVCVALSVFPVPNSGPSFRAGFVGMSNDRRRTLVLLKLRSCGESKRKPRRSDRNRPAEPARVERHFHVGNDPRFQRPERLLAAGQLFLDRAGRDQSCADRNLSGCGGGNGCLPIRRSAFSPRAPVRSFALPRGDCQPRRNGNQYDRCFIARVAGSPPVVA